MSGEPDRQRPGAGLWAAVRILPSISRWRTALLGGLVVAAATLPVAFVVATGLVVGRIPAVVRSGGLSSHAGDRLITALVVAAVLYVAQQVANQVLQVVAETLGRRLNGVLRERVMRASLAPTGIAHLEDAALLDTISLARNVAPGQWQPGGAVVGLARGSVYRLQAVVSAVVVAVLFSVPLAIGLLVLFVWTQWRLVKLFLATVEVITGQTPDLRRSAYLRDLALTAAAAKELRIFGLRGWVNDRFSASWRAAMTEAWRQRRSGRLDMVVTVGAVSVGMFGGLALVVRAAIDGDIDLSRLAILVGAVSGAVSLTAGDSDLAAAYGAVAVPALLRLEDDVASARGVPASLRLPDLSMPAHEVRFESVDFAYPGAERRVFSGLDLAFPAGRSVALVGANGAGKTTLVKLLGRLYEPSGGRVTVDGVDLAALDPDGWRRQMAVLFQDYVRYELSASDNVGLGAVDHLGDRSLAVRAAERAGALEVVERLPASWETVLSRTVTDGADLSGGQWQRIALARALAAVESGARLLVLDEPSASLDVRAEAALYDRFLDLTRGLTTVLVSHRFSTVRRADHIVVLEAGRVAEQGSHDELIAASGRYAEMFHLQAARFVEEDLGA
ncbi:MAG: ATP-binding cassette, subfamily bacterial [Actinomycetota bacterium]|jgi:ATP-binding cassette subfamily B protein|nr:ATP-binding cassette, subfamily bacterial [Actinomycetota bacterium]